MNIHSQLPEADLENGYVFLRADLNVPLVQSQISDDFRLRSLQPTLDLLITKKAKIVLGTHIGRPQGYDPALSTKILIPWFEKHGYRITFASCLEEATQKKASLLPGSILLLENLRFDPREKSTNNDQRHAFAKQLNSLAPDYYVNDAFGLLHRHDTSITDLPAVYDPECKTLGLLVEKEVNTLSHYFEEPAQPFMVILGGGKVRDKLPHLEELITAKKIQAIMPLPAIVFTFLKALNKPIGQSLVVDEEVSQAARIMKMAQNNGITFVFPLDYLVAEESFEGPLRVVEADAIGETDVGLAVGPQTLEYYSCILKKMKMIYINGAMGLPERPETMEALKRLLQTIAQLNVCCIIGGGESVAAVYQYDLENTITYCSTGGGASLYFLTYGTLPALF